MIFEDQRAVTALIEARCDIDAGSLQLVHLVEQRGR
jgi:hypothetical protein